MFYRNTQGSNSKINIWKEKNTENSSPLINNNRIALRTRLFIVFLALAIISSVLIISHTQNEVLAKKTTGNKSGIDGGYDAASLSGNNTSDTTSSNSTSSSSSGGNTSATNQAASLSGNSSSSSSGGNTSATNQAASLSGNSSSSSSAGSSSSSSEGNSDLKNTVAPVDETHCDKKGYPSCYNLGYSDGQNAPGTSCPSDHSEAYCNGYEAASLSGNNTSDTTSPNSSSSSSSAGSEANSDLKNTVAPVDETHCDKKGYPSCRSEERRVGK